MPILLAEPQVHPEGLLENPQVPSPEQRWWVLHTRPRQEKSLARQLFANGISFYLPLLARRLRVRNRTMTSFSPLFPGYLFLLAEAEERVSALATGRIVRALPVVDQAKMHHDLVQLYRLIATGAPITPEDRLGPGDAVEIRSGPLMGLRGKILKSASGRRFVVEVDFIQRGASILFDDSMLGPVTA